MVQIADKYFYNGKEYTAKELYKYCRKDITYAAFKSRLNNGWDIEMALIFKANPGNKAEMRNYYEMIAGLQERYLRPALERLLPVMAISCFGYLPEDLDFVFNPLATVTAEESEELAGKERVLLMYELSVNVYMGNENVQLVVKDYKY